MSIDVALFFLVIAIIVIVKLCMKISDQNHIKKVSEERDAKERQSHYKTSCELDAAKREITSLEKANARLKEKLDSSTQDLFLLKEKYQNISNAPTLQETRNGEKNYLEHTKSQTKYEIKKLTNELNQKTSENKSLKSTLKRVEKENEELKVSLQKSTQLSAKSNTRNYSQNISLPIDDIIVKRLSSPTQFEKIDVCWDSRTLALYKNGVKDGRLTKAINEKTYTRFSSPVQLSIDKILDFSVEVTPHDKKERQRLSQKNSNSFYTTTLKNCSCYYFQNTSSGMAACKHMFALALYLNVITPDGKFNDSISIQKNIL